MTRLEKVMAQREERGVAQVDQTYSFFFRWQGFNGYVTNDARERKKD